MKARILRYCDCGLYWGQVYDYRYERWITITPGCFTKWGCRMELEKFKRKVEPEEFEL